MWGVLVRSEGTLGRMVTSEQLVFGARLIEGTHLFKTHDKSVLVVFIRVL